MEARIHEAAVEEMRLPRVVDRERVLAHAGGAEIVGLAADRDHQRVVGHAAHRQDLPALVVLHRGHDDVARGAIEPLERAEHEGEAVPARLREVVELVRVDVHAARGHFVQERLPEVRAAAIDERHVGAALLAERVAQARGELEPAGAAAHHDDPLRHGWPKSFVHSAVQRSHSSSMIAGSTRPYSNWLSGLFTARLAGTRLRSSMILWPSRERMKSAKRRAAYGCGASRARPMELGCPNAGCSGFHSIG